MNSLHDEKEFKSKLKVWAENAVEYCHKVATDPDEDKRIDKAFYAFQSEPIKEPKVLILAINPHENKGEDWNYEEQRKKWEGIKDGMTPEVFMKKNPKWDDQKKWPIWLNLEKVFHTNKLRAILDKGDFMFMNVLYFNSISINDFYNINKNSKEVFDECVKMTTNLITNIIKPVHIVCLSIPNCFEKLNTEKPVLLFPGKIRLLIKGNICGYDAYGIPHTSGARGVTPQNWGNIGLLLHKEIFKEDLNINLKRNIDIIQKNLVQIAETHNLILNLDKEQLSKQFGFFKFSIKDIDWLSIYFEFQSPYYGDLKYGFNVSEEKRDKLSENEKKNLGYKGDTNYYKNYGWIILQKCEEYSNWMNLDDNFNIEEFEVYFKSLILSMVEKLKNLN